MMEGKLEMKTTSKLFVAAVLSAVSVSAVWGAPCNDANIGRGYAAYPYGEPRIAPPLTEEQRSVFAERQKAFAEQQARFATQAMEAQRQYIEQLMANQPPLPEPFSGNRMPFEPAFDRGLEGIQAEREQMQSERDQIRKQMEVYRHEIAASRPVRPDFAESKARRAALRAQMEARRAEMLKQVEAQRKEVQERHAAMRTQVEERQLCRES
jgi:hypothetical protein